MARSKPRKKNIEKVRTERRAQHQENRALKEHAGLLHELALDILQHHPPFKKEEPVTLQEIEHWFDTDPEAPLIVMSMPPGDPQVQVSTNQHAIDRELHLRGIGEGHPSWDVARRAMGPIMVGVTRTFLREAGDRVARGELPLRPPSGE